MSRELYLVAGQGRNSKDHLNVSDQMVENNPNDDEIKINGFEKIIEDLLEYLSPNCQENFQLILDKLNHLKVVTGRLEINTNDFTSNLDELIAICHNPPWGLLKKARSGNSALPYLEKLVEMSDWLNKHKNVRNIKLDYWDNTSGYEAYPVFEISVDLKSVT